MSCFQETLQDSTGSGRRPKRDSGEGEGKGEGVGGEEEGEGGGEGDRVDEAKTPLWVQRTCLLQQKDVKVAIFSGPKNHLNLNFQVG